MATIEHKFAETFVSLHDQMIARGRAEGRAEGRAAGRAEGQAEMFAGLLRLTFDDVNERVEEAVFAASTEQVAAWSASLIEGTLTLDDITG